MKVKYESYIEQLVEDNNLNRDEVLVSLDDANITIEDFIRKTKKMQPWHKRLLNNLSEIRNSQGDIINYMRRYTADKVKSGFNFKE